MKFLGLTSCVLVSSLPLLSAYEDDVELSLRDYISGTVDAINAGQDLESDLEDHHIPYNQFRNLLVDIIEGCDLSQLSNLYSYNDIYDNDEDFDTCNDVNTVLTSLKKEASSEAYAKLNVLQETEEIVSWCDVSCQKSLQSYVLEFINNIRIEDLDLISASFI